MNKFEFKDMDNFTAKKKRVKFFYNIYIMICIILITPLIAQNSINSEIENNRNKLKKIRIKIDSLKVNIAETERKKKSTLEQLNIIQNEMAFLSEARGLLRKEINLLTKRIEQTKKDLEKIKSILEMLWNQAEKKIIYNYKYGKIRNVELLLKSSSFNQALVRYKYLKLFWQQEVKLINSIKAKMEEKKKFEYTITADLKNRKSALQEKENDHRIFNGSKKKKEKLIQELKWTSDNLRQELNSLEMSRKKIQETIMAREAQKRKKVEKKYTSIIKNFKKGKGKLPWPVEGKIISKYGKVHDKTLNTWVKNTGIDIKAKSGSKVRAIFPGIVSMITYLPGYGNTIILDHNNGYYTVYAHLDDIFVERDELVEGKQLIGLVGDSGSLEGPKLHFEVYANQNTENPLLWLQ